MLGDHACTPADETAPLDPPALVAWRPAVEQRVLEAATPASAPWSSGPGVVYGGARGIISDMLTDADNGLMRVIGTGENHWPVVYDRDLADLYVAPARERADAAGVFHATDESGETVRDIVEAIAAHAPSRPDVRYMPLAEARKKRGPLADALVLDQLVRSPARPRARLDAHARHGHPQHPAPGPGVAERPPGRERSRPRRRWRRRRRSTPPGGCAASLGGGRTSARGWPVAVVRAGSCALTRRSAGHSEKATCRLVNQRAPPP